MDSTAWDQRYRAADRLWSAEPNLFVRDRLGPLDPGTGLDLAAGDGRNSKWLAERGWAMTAVDFSNAAIEKGREVSPGVDLVVGDVRTWEPATRYSLVLIAYLHLPKEQLEKVVVRASGWLEPRGQLFMIGHDRSNLDNGYGGPPSPEVLWEVDTMRQWLNGMTVIEAQVVRRPKETEGGDVAYARDTLLRAMHD